jgi:hypothetical protein
LVPKAVREGWEFVKIVITKEEKKIVISEILRTIEGLSHKAIDDSIEMSDPIYQIASTLAFIKEQFEKEK